jgi:hypothetical protein
MRSVIAIAAVACLVAPAEAQNRRERQAKARYEKGAAHFKAKRYDQALVEFRAAYQILPRPALHFNIARALHEKGDKQEALAEYRRYLEAQPDGPAAGEAREYVAALEAELAPPAAEPAPPAAEPAPPAAEPAPPAAEPAPPPTASGLVDAGPPGGSAPRRAPDEEPRVERVGPPPARPSWLSFGATVGLAAADVAGWADWHGGMRYGLAAGAFVRWSPLPWLAVRPELLYVQRGCSGYDEQGGYFWHWHTDFVETALLGELVVGGGHLDVGGYWAKRVSADTPFDESLTGADYGLTFGGGSRWRRATNTGSPT